MLLIPNTFATRSITYRNTYAQNLGIILEEKIKTINTSY